MEQTPDERGWQTSEGEQVPFEERAEAAAEQIQDRLERMDVFVGGYEMSSMTHSV